MQNGCRPRNATFAVNGIDCRSSDNNYRDGDLLSRLQVFVCMVIDWLGRSHW